MKKFVITIGRQYGSGGKEVGERLAERLGIACYDKKLIAMAAQKGGFDPKRVSELDLSLIHIFRRVTKEDAGKGVFYPREYRDVDLSLIHIWSSAGMKKAGYERPIL